MNMIADRMIRNKLNRAAGIYMTNRAMLNTFGELIAAIMNANSIAGIEIAAKDAILIISLPNPLLSRFTPRNPK